MLQHFLKCDMFKSIFPRMQTWDGVKLIKEINKWPREGYPNYFATQWTATDPGGWRHISLVRSSYTVHLHQGVDWDDLVRKRTPTMEWYSFRVLDVSEAIKKETNNRPGTYRVRFKFEGGGLESFHMCCCRVGPTGGRDELVTGQALASYSIPWSSIADANENVTVAFLAYLENGKDPAIDNVPYPGMLVYQPTGDPVKYPTTLDPNNPNIYFRVDPA